MASRKKPVAVRRRALIEKIAQLQEQLWEMGGDPYPHGRRYYVVDELLIANGDWMTANEILDIIFKKGGSTTVDSIAALLARYAKKMGWESRKRQPEGEANDHPGRYPLEYRKKKRTRRKKAKKKTAKAK